MRVVFLILFFVQLGHTGEVAIPIAEIWGHGLDGTRPLSKLGERGVNTLAWIDKTLSENPLAYENSRPFSGFAVPGTPPRALTWARKALTSREQLSFVESGIPLGEDVHAVFFSYATAYKVRLGSVVRNGNTFSITYQFVPQHSYDVSRTLALVPLGKLPVGEYQVRIIQDPLEQKYLDAGFKPVPVSVAELLVSTSFTFRIINPPQPLAAAAGGVKVIPAEDFIGGPKITFASLEPELRIKRDTPEKIAKYSTPEGLAEFQEKANASLSLAVENATAEFAPLGAPAKTGFAVSGEGRGALEAVHDVIVNHADPSTAFDADSPISLVCFKHTTSPTIHFRRAEISPGVVKVYYELNTRFQTAVNAQLVLIPCGKLPPGAYKVEMIRVRAENPSKLSGKSVLRVEPGVEETIVSRPFEFFVKRRVAQQE